MKKFAEVFSMKSMKQNRLLFMILGFAVTLILLLYISRIDISASWGYILLIILCPLMHIFMHKNIHSVNHNPDDPKH